MIYYSVLEADQCHLQADRDLQGPENSVGREGDGEDRDKLRYVIV